MVAGAVRSTDAKFRGLYPPRTRQNRVYQVEKNACRMAAQHAQPRKQSGHHILVYTPTRAPIGQYQHRGRTTPTLGAWDRVQHVHILLHWYCPARVCQCVLHKSGLPT
jgi:hypothetical protein